MKRGLPWLLEAAGGAGVVAGVWLVDMAAGLIVAGLIAIGAALALERIL